MLDAMTRVTAARLQDLRLTDRSRDILEGRGKAKHQGSSIQSLEGVFVSVWKNSTEDENLFVQKRPFPINRIQALLISVRSKQEISFVNVLLSKTFQQFCLSTSQWNLCITCNTPLKSLSTAQCALIIDQFPYFHCDEFLHPGPVVRVGPLLSQAKEEGAGRALAAINEVQYSWRIGRK